MSIISAKKLVMRGLQSRHTEDAFFSEVKTGATWSATELSKIDAVAVHRSWAKPCITAYEIKVSKSDFLSDSKWHAYLPHCHRFYFACQAGLLKPDDIPDPAGLVVVGPKGARAVKKTALRPIEIPADLLYYLVICRDAPPLSALREPERGIDVLREWVEGKRDKRQLAWRVTEKLQKALEDIERRERAVECYEEKYACAKELNEILDEEDITPGGYDWQDRLRERLHHNVRDIGSQIIELARKLGSV